MTATVDADAVDLQRQINDLRSDLPRTSASGGSTVAGKPAASGWSISAW